MKTSVVIPQFNGWTMTHSLLFDLYNWCKGISEVLLVDNGSTEKDGRDWWLGNGMLPLRVDRLEENVGFLKAANYGMSKATGDILILISNDVQIKENIILPITTILYGLELHKSYDIHSKPVPKVVGGRLLDYDTGWNQFDGRIYPYLEGWLLACWKKDWEAVGGFDERFSPSDMEDVDVSTAFISKGYSLVGLDTSAVTHLGAQTLRYSPEREAITLANKEKFRAKWVK